ncbi:RrF2 family transcriptional regulator [Nitrobacter sp.]|jgi:Rrf2 family nitric oxide-sensitive transcriptional repressor|uniref:RrF2 family transcriptional regulator n=1 Tax=Nitrobacter sp. TaxID=29420 RepID=UPI003F64FF05
MRLTTYSDYALRVLMYLALKSDGLSTIAAIAESYDISEAHLMKVVHQLGVAGYVETVRGRGGGVRLARPVEAISLAEVIRTTEPDMAIVSCLKPINASCTINPSCVLKRALQRAQDAFMEVLEGYTLADLVAPRARLAGLLGISPGASPQ